MFDDRRIHEVARGSNLDLILRAFNGIGNRFVDAVLNLGDGLHEIAVAISTSDDNSAEVKALADRLKIQREALQKSINQQGE